MSSIKLRKFNKLGGFTTVELVVVLGIIGLLAAIILVAVNPSREAARSRDAQRKAELIDITNAVYQFTIENNGDLPDTNPDPLVNNFPLVATCIGIGKNCFDLAHAGNIEAPKAQLKSIVPTYLPVLPQDPLNGSLEDTKYFIYKDANGVLIATGSGELSPTVTVSR